MNTNFKLKLAVIMLAAAIVGMLMFAPSLFVGDIFVGGLIFAVVAGVIGYFILKRGAHTTS